jgi:seryl-tRNA synthetase
MVGKFRTHDDSLFNVNNTLSTLRTSINDNSIQIKNGKKEYDGLLERIEKLETDTVLAKDEMEQKMDSLNMQINGVKEISVPRKAFEDHTTMMRDELFTDLKSNEEEVKKLALRVIDLEKKAP